MFKRCVWWVVTVGVAWLVLACAGNGAAQEENLTPRETELLNVVERLDQRVGDIEKQVEALKNALPANMAPAQTPAQPAANEAAAPTPKTESKPPIEMKAFWKDGLRFESADKQFKVQLGGRIHLDGAWFDQDRRLRDTVGDEQDGLQIRRGRLALGCDFYDDLFFRLEYDFAGNNPPGAFMDAFLGVRNIPYAGMLTLGHFREPFSLERLTNGNYTTFIERALPDDVFAPGRISAPCSTTPIWASPDRNA